MGPRALVFSFLLVAAVVASGCDTSLERDPKSDGAVPDVATVDTRATNPDAPRPDLPQPPPPCPKCPPASGSKICLSGRVYPLHNLAGKWSGLNPLAGHLTVVDGVIVKVYDPIEFVSNPAGTQPLGTASIDADGCFMVKDISIPFSNMFAVGVDDDPSTGNDRWALTGTSVMPTPGRNSEDLEIGAIANQEAQAWGLDLLTAGTMIMVFLDESGKAVEGVTPTYDGKPPPWTGTDMSVYFLDEDLTKPPYFDPSATATTESGMVAVKKAEVKNFSGQKPGCTIGGSMLGGSSPGTIFLRIYNVTGC
jgi:hypothetical protein